MNTIPDGYELCPDDFRLRIVEGDPEYDPMRARVTKHVAEKNGLRPFRDRDTKKMKIPSSMHLDDSVDLALRELFTQPAQLEKCLPERLFERYWKGRAVWRYRQQRKSEGRDTKKLQKWAYENPGIYQPKAHSRGQGVFRPEVDSLTECSVATLAGTPPQLLLLLVSEWQSKSLDHLNDKLANTHSERNKKAFENEIYLVENILSILSESDSRDMGEDSEDDGNGKGKRGRMQLDGIKKRLPHQRAVSRISQMIVPMLGQLRAFLLVNSPSRTLCIVPIPVESEELDEMRERGVQLSLTDNGYPLIGDGYIRIASYNYDEIIECADSKGNRFDCQATTLLLDAQHDHMPVGRPNSMRLELRTVGNGTISVEHDGRMVQKSEGQEKENKPDWGMPLHLTADRRTEIEGAKVVYEYGGEAAKRRRSRRAVNLNLTVELNTPNA